MFAQVHPASAARERWVRTASVAAHALVLAWLIHPPKPQRLTAFSVALGQNGTSVTRLYWSSKNPDESSHSSSDLATQRYRHERLGQKLAFTVPPKLAKLPAQRTPIARADTEDQAKTQTLSAEGHGAQAGQLYGTLYHGPLNGDEIRPALPVTTSDPIVWPWQLPVNAGK